MGGRRPRPAGAADGRPPQGCPRGGDDGVVARGATRRCAVALLERARHVGITLVPEVPAPETRAWGQAPHTCTLARASAEPAGRLFAAATVPGRNACPRVPRARAGARHGRRPPAHGSLKRAQRQQQQQQQQPVDARLTCSRREGAGASLSSPGWSVARGRSHSPTPQADNHGSEPASAPHQLTAAWQCRLPLAGAG